VLARKFAREPDQCSIGYATCLGIEELLVAEYPHWPDAKRDSGNLPRMKAFTDEYRDTSLEREYRHD
jgi:hypothetical protein